jgi:hypothetical protein
MFIKKRFVALVLFAGVVLTSCGGQATEVPTMDANAIMTDAVNTFIANINQTQTAQALLVTASPAITSSPISLVTATPPPTWTSAPIFNPVLPTIFKSPTATGTQYTPTANPALLASGCNNLRLIQDVSIPAGSVIKPGETFTKTWKVENSGTCDWVYLYRLVFVSGDRMDGEPSGLGKVIVPGKWTQLSVTLIAPKKAGTYTGNWRFGTQTGSPFGSTLTVSIVVGTPTDTPQPTLTQTPVPPTSTSTSTDTATPTYTSYP